MNERQLAILSNELTLPAYNDLLAARDYVAVAESLNRRAEVPNPAPQTPKPRRVPFEEFLQVLKPADVLLLYQSAPILAQEYRMYQQMGDRASGRKLWNGMKGLAFDPATITAIDALWDATELDPDWTPTVQLPSRAMALGLPVVEDWDIELVDQRLHGR